MVAFVRTCVALGGHLCLSRYPGILPPSAQGYHRVCWTEDRCLSELKGGGKRHPFLPPHRASSGMILLFQMSKLKAANLNVSQCSWALFCLFVVNLYPGCVCSPKCVWSLTPFSLNSDFTLASTTGGKDLGLSRWYRNERRTCSVFDCFISFCGLFLLYDVLVWAWNWVCQSAMEAKRPEAFYTSPPLSFTWEPGKSHLLWQQTIVRFETGSCRISQNTHITHLAAMLWNMISFSSMEVVLKHGWLLVQFCA